MYDNYGMTGFEEKNVTPPTCFIMNLSSISSVFVCKTMRDEKELIEKLLNKIMHQFVLNMLNDNSLISVKTNQSRRLGF